MMAKLKFAVILLLAISSGCSLTSDRLAVDQLEKIDRVWPEKPAKARITYVNSFASAADLGISKSFFARVVDFFTGRDDWQLTRPMAVLATDDGIIYVADPGSKTVHRFDPGNSQYTAIMTRDEKAPVSPVGLAMGTEGEIYIADSFLGQVFVVPDGSDTAEVFALDVVPKQPTNIAVDPKSRRLYVVDSASHNIKVYRHDGILLNTIGQRGNKDGEFNFPSMIWLDQQDRLLVSDALNFRIQMFDLDGLFIGKFGQHGDGTGDMSRPKGVASDNQGHIYVVDALFHSMQLFNDSGEFLLNVGRRGNAAGEFLLPTGIHITRDNMIYIADSHNSRVQVFRYIGDRP